MLRSLISFAKKVLVSVCKNLIKFVKDSIFNAPATAVMTLATIGIAPIVGKYALLIPALYFIDSYLLIPVLSATIILSLAWLAGYSAKRRVYVL